ncbi:MAG: hypothetical protein CFH41_01102 [Alphaproteobacteria bacterium MarineAlpha11_Bin1]|nr:MAG: hypothetical protein CFH41_01102 [Alphaproteobacteria bacterium MarineAlpha11_Bin1]
MTVRPVHFVGSIPLADSETVFRAIADTVCTAAPRWPDGETGERAYWIRWQKQTFDNHPDFELKSTNSSIHGYKDDISRPFYVLRDGVDAADVSIEDMGYAANAEKSYATFARLKREGVIPEWTRFQVSIPTAVALTVGFFEISERAAAEPIIEAALALEVAAIADAIPHDQLAIQWDVCHEVVAADGGLSLHYENIVDASVERIARHLGFVPGDIEAGIHLCYGDPGHKHIIEPQDLDTCVIYANRITTLSPRSVEFIHMPVPYDRADNAYFAPLARLKLQSKTQLFMGLVHFSDGIDGTRGRLNTAVIHAGREIGISTECGFGRRDPVTIPELLNIHLVVAQ